MKSRRTQMRVQLHDAFMDRYDLTFKRHISRGTQAKEAHVKAQVKAWDYIAGMFLGES